MNLLDLGIIVLLGLITVRGFFRGLFQEVAVLVGVVGGGSFYPAAALSSLPGFF
jgi:uncharacterized membrane protein required for colicin V production